jgi:hypothetical protein
MLRLPARLSEKLLYLSVTLGSSDFAPTEARRAVAKELHDQLLTAKAQVDALLKTDANGIQKVMGSSGGTP